MAKKKPPELTFQKHTADYLVREHKYAVLDQSDITVQLKAAGDVLGIEFLDHIIFNRTGYFSFLEAGKL